MFIIYHLIKSSTDRIINTSSWIHNRGMARQTTAPKIGDIGKSIQGVTAYQSRDLVADTSMETSVGVGKH